VSGAYALAATALIVGWIVFIALIVVFVRWSRSEDD